MKEHSPTQLFMYGLFLFPRAIAGGTCKAIGDMNLTNLMCFISLSETTQHSCARSFSIDSSAIAAVTLQMDTIEEAFREGAHRLPGHVVNREQKKAVYKNLCR